MSPSQTSNATAPAPVSESSIARSRLARVYVYTGRNAKVTVEKVVYPVSVESAEDLMPGIAEILGTISRGFGRKWVPVRLYDGRADPACYWMLANHEHRMRDDEAHNEPDGERKEWQAFLSSLPKDREQYLAQEEQDFGAEPGPDPEPEDMWREPAAVEDAPSVGVQELMEPSVREQHATVESVRPAMVERRVQQSFAAPAPAPYNPGEHFQMESLMSRGKHSTAAARGWRGTLNRTGLLTLAPSQSELEWRAAKSTMAMPWEGLRVVSVVNEKGGAGKSPVSAMLAAAFALETPFAVHLFDNNENGNISDRLSLTGAHTSTAKDLASAYKARGGLTRSQMESLLHFHEEDRYGLLAGHRPRFRGDALTPEEVHNIYLAQEEHVSLSVTDSGNTLTSPNWEQMALESDQLVVPVMTAPDRDQGALTTLAALEDWGKTEPLFKEKAMASVILISQWRPKDDVKTPAARWSEKVPEGNVVVIPYDAHLGSHDLRFSALKPRTQLAFMKAAAAVRRGWAE